MLNKLIPLFTAVLLTFVQPCATFAEETSPATTQETVQAIDQPDTAGEASQVAEESTQEEEKGIAPAAEDIFTIPIGSTGLPVTNSMLMSWIVSLCIILLIRLAAGRPKLVPTRAQAVIEGLVKMIRDMLESIVGKRMIGPTFPLLFGLFTFILIQNWSGLIPFVGSFGLVENGHMTAFLRPGNADLNMTLGLTLVHFIMWFYFVMRFAGPKVLLLDLFGNKAPKDEVPRPIYYFMFILFAAVGIIEVISLLFRNISLPFRLYGNMYGGDNLMESMYGIFSWLLPIPFYFMELLVGLVQALVFMILVSVYIGQICNHDTGEH